jgi:hypothetical protein
VEIARIEGDEVLVTKGLADGENVITTPLKAVTDGMTVRMISKPSALRQAQDRLSAVSSQRPSKD